MKILIFVLTAVGFLAVVILSNAPANRTPEPLSMAQPIKAVSQDFRYGTTCGELLSSLQFKGQPLVTNEQIEDARAKVSRYCVLLSNRPMATITPADIRILNDIIICN